MKYNFVNDVLNNIELITDIGINIELNDLLKNIKTAIYYSINIVDNKYIVEVGLNELNKYDIDKIFTEIFMFIKYQSLNVYFREIEGNRIKYFLVSGDCDRGFCCEFSFKQYMDK